MEIESRMEQHYAVSTAGVLTHIRQAHESSEDYFCPHCKCRMIKVCGRKREWHFRHDPNWQSDIEKECSYESYLHAYAKLRLKEWFESSPEIVVKYNQRKICEHFKTCDLSRDKEMCSTTEKKSYNLKRCLNKCSVEETVKIGDGQLFRADLLWCSDRKPENYILVEIKVTHGCTEKKRCSQARIIEFEVHSEKDIEAIVRSHEIAESENVHFYGFNTEKVDPKIRPKFQLKKFILYSSGKVYANTICSCQNYKVRRDNSQMEFSILLDDAPKIGKLHSWGLSLAWQKGLDVRNCYMCKFHKFNYEESVLNCEKCEEKIDGEKAIKCEHFIVDEAWCKEHLTLLKKFQSYCFSDVWMINDMK